MIRQFDAILRRIRIAFVVAAVAMAIFGVVSYQTIARLERLAISSVDTQDDLMLLQQASITQRRAQTALRDYVSSGAPADLQNFEARAWAQKAAVEALGQGPELPHQGELERLVAQRTRQQYEVAATRTAGDHEEALRLLDSISAHDLQAQIAGMVEAIEDRAEQDWWSTHAVPTASGAERVVVAATLLLVAMFVWVFWIVRRYERERRRVTGLLDDSEAMGRLLAGNMADGLVTMSDELVVLEVNRAALAVLGHPQGEIIGRPAAELLGASPGDGDFRARLRALLADRAPFQLTGVEMVAIRSDGRQIPVQVSLNDVWLGGQRRVIALIRDMSRIRAASEAVRASEQHLREMADTLPVLIAELDPQLRFRFVNRACAEFLGGLPQDAIGQPASEVLGPELYARHQPHFAQVLRGGAVRYEVTAGGATGEVGTYEMRLLPRRAGGKLAGFYAVAHDITLLRRIDRMKTEFISTVSHELRTPLTSVRGSLGLMSAGVVGKLPEAAAHLVAIAQNNCDRLIRLINDILDSEKIESGEVPLRLQAMELAPLLRKALTDNEGFAQQHGVRLRLAAPATPLAARVDSDRLLQVLTNLVSNAVKFSPADAEVDVRLSGPPDRIRIEVSDRGPGIPLEFQHRIFRKFSQADSSDTRAKGGTGLGLSISRTLVERMGGQIGFASTPGQGTTFFFELPRHDARPAPAFLPTRPATIPAPLEDR
jgi:PAS domain S-box-containing protein